MRVSDHFTLSLITLVWPYVYGNIVSQLEYVVDTKTPVVIHHAISGSDPTLVDNHFGYSLSFFGESQSARFWGDGGTGSRSSRTYGTLFIGAPKEKQLTRSSGVVWGCQFGSNSQLTCSLVSSISNQKTISENSSYTCSQTNPSFPEREEEQLIGDNLIVSDDLLISCAPRWKLNNYKVQTSYGNYRGSCESRTALIGACYFVETKDKVNLRSPYLDRQYDFYKRNLYWFALAEFGFSSHVSNALPKSKVFIGSPGARSWSGNFAQYDFRNGDEMKIFNEEGDYREIRANSYLGYSITSGKSLRNQFYVAAGAPRARNLLGLVVLLTSFSHERKIISGEQLGSYFGYTLATADLDGNGIDELLVGAPWQSGSTYSSGCVFIYDLNSILYASPSSNPTYQTRLCPDSQRSHLVVTKGARFGSAIVNMGDINNDKFQDFAVGAPSNEEGVGSVFIFYGRRTPLSDRDIQGKVIHGKSFDILNLRGFGSYLLSGDKVDIDGNQTPDLAIGAYESRHVVLLRSRPAVGDTKLAITFHEPESQKKILKFLPNQESVLVRVCIYLTFSVPMPRDLILNTWVTFEMDPKIKRFGGPIVEQEGLKIGWKCIDRKFSANQQISEGQEDITFEVSLVYNETVESSSRPEAVRMTLSTGRREARQQLHYSQDKEYENTFGQFKPYLPAPFFMQKPKQERLEIADDNCKADNDPRCVPQLNLKLKLFTENVKGQKTEYNWEGQKKPLVIGEVNTLTVFLTLTNSRETAYRPVIYIILEGSQNIDLRESQSFLQLNLWQRSGKKRQCENKVDFGDSNNVTHSLRCSQSLHNGTQMEYAWSLGNLRQLTVTNSDGKAELDVKVQAYPADDFQYKTETYATIPLKTDVDITVNTMSPSRQTKIDPKKNYVDFFQHFSIKNSGYTSTAMESVKAEILVPTHVYIQKNFTKVVGLVNPSNQNLRCTGDFFDPGTELRDLNKTTTDYIPTKESRSRRAANSVKNETPKLQIINPEAATLVTSSDNVITLTGCDTTVGAESCQKIVCYTDIPSKTSREIRLHMFLLPNAQSQLIKEDHLGARIDSIMTVSYMNMKIKTISGKTERMFVFERGIPAYVYLLSAAGGAILFLLITFALFKCGFFRRKAKEQLQQLKRQTMHMGEMQEIQDLPEDDTTGS